jgi:hypothetical protein
MSQRETTRSGSKKDMGDSHVVLIVFGFFSKLLTIRNLLNNTNKFLKDKVEEYSNLKRYRYRQVF